MRIFGQCDSKAAETIDLISNNPFDNCSLCVYCDVNDAFKLPLIDPLATDVWKVWSVRDLPREATLFDFLSSKDANIVRASKDLNLVGFKEVETAWQWAETWIDGQLVDTNRPNIEEQIDKIKVLLSDGYDQID